MGNPYQLCPNGFAVDPDNGAYGWLASAEGAAVGQWRRDQILNRIARNYGARWFADGNIAGWLEHYVVEAQTARRLPVLVPYNIMGRDLGWHSDGGAVALIDYLTWVVKWTAAIKDRPCVVVLEPDSIIHQIGMADPQQALRQAALSYATAMVAERCPSTWTYMDAGVRSDWHPPVVLAKLLLRSGVLRTRGVYVNAANFMRTLDAAEHAKRVVAELNKLTGLTFGFIIDTSRNGNGMPPITGSDWMINPKDRKLGENPVFVNGYGADALTWIKLPGASDGLAGTPADVPSGQFDDRIAISLIRGVWTP